MVVDVEATLGALEANQPLPEPVPVADTPAGPPPLPFRDSAAIREYLSNPRNAAVLASYVMEQVQDYTGANFPRQFALLLLSTEYKSVVFWTPVAPK